MAANQACAVRSKERDLLEIEQQVKAFHATFKQQHGRRPTQEDLACAENVRMKVLVERYQLLKHGIAPRALQGGRDRSRALQHRY